MSLRVQDVRNEKFAIIQTDVVARTIDGAKRTCSITAVDARTGAPTTKTYRFKNRKTPAPARAAPVRGVGISRGRGQAGAAREGSARRQAAEALPASDVVQRAKSDRKKPEPKPKVRSKFVAVGGSYLGSL